MNQTKMANIVPDITIMKKMASISGSIYSRILELVDNSVDAKLNEKDLMVDVNVMKKNKEQYIEIIDNGHGMTEKDAKQFFKLGKSEKEGLSKIGRFGMGSKVAIIGLGNVCKIETSPIGKPYSIEIDFDIRKFDSWEIEYKIKEEAPEKHYTKIKITDLTININNMEVFADKLYKSLQKTYKHFIKRDDINVRVNNRKVEQEKIELMSGLYKEFDFEVEGKRVHGWAGVKKEKANAWKYGFDLISFGRIIKGNDLLAGNTKTNISRLIGEIHLDDFATDVHKTDFIRYKDDFRKMRDHLIEKELKELINEVSKLASKEVYEKFKGEMEEVSERLNKAIHNENFLNQLELSNELFKNQRTKTEADTTKITKETNEKVNEEKKEDKEKKERNESDKKTRAVYNNLVINEPVGVAAGENQPTKRWFAEKINKKTHLNIEVNMDHPTFKIDNDERIKAFMDSALVDSVSEFIVQEEKRNGGNVDDEIQRLIEIKELLVRYII